MISVALKLSYAGTDFDALKEFLGTKSDYPLTSGRILDGAADIVLNHTASSGAGYMSAGTRTAHLSLFVADRGKLDAIALWLDRWLISRNYRSRSLTVSAVNVEGFEDIRKAIGKSLAVPSIFLCHSSKDRVFVRQLGHRLAHAGASVWIDEAEIKVGDSLTGRIGSAIEEADFLGAVLSKVSIASEWVRKELAIALQRELKEKHVVVLPLLLEKVALPPFLSDKNYADFTDSNLFEHSFARVLDRLGLTQESQGSRHVHDGIPPPT